MTPEEYQAKVKASPTYGGYASSSKRWRDHLLVYPNLDRSSIDNVRWLERKAIEDEEFLAEALAQAEAAT